MTQLDWIDQAQQRVARAQRELQRLVDERRESFVCRDFARRRAAMLRRTRPNLNQGER